MRGLRSRSMLQRWARFALKCGLLLTDTKMWSSITDQVRGSYDDLGNEVTRRYEETADRLHDVHDALHGRNHWAAPTVSFLAGAGVGVGLGLLLAPASGEETRSAIRGKVVDWKNKVGDVAARKTEFRSTPTTHPTGTEGN